MHKPKILIVLLVLETVLLFYFSIQPGPAIDTNLTRRGDLEHFLAYLLYAVLWFSVLSRYAPNRNRNLILSITLAALVGGMNEMIQLFVPGRISDILDFLTNLLGALSGAALLFIFYCKKSKKDQEKEGQV